MELPIREAKWTHRLDRLYIKSYQAMGLLALPWEYSMDLLYYLTNCRLSPRVARETRDSYDLIFFAHTIEKGLSLPQPRPLFGKNNIARVLNLLRKCDAGKLSPAALKMGLGCLMEYIDYHKKIGNESDFIVSLEKEADELARTIPFSADGGTKDIGDNKRRILDGTLSYPQFIESRYSCRNFLPDAIAPAEVYEIIRIAQAAPSQCNRQSTRAYHYGDKEKIRQLLDLQGGARGFAATVPTLMVITNELWAWTGRNERNQCYVDGGLFSMCLLLAFHSKNIGVCALNFAKTNGQERSFRKAAGIPRGERVIMLIAAGHQDPANTTAARSVRRPVESVCRSL
ncbi:MAG: nitroreductase family protein [Verrucomicrobiota bacterium]